MKKETVSILKEISDSNNADIYLFSGKLEWYNVDSLIYKIRAIPEETRNENVILILTTYGGDPDDAYRLIVYLQRHYKKIILLLFGYCKSAGTLIALGCHEIAYGDFGELGALDIQLAKADELTNISALSYYQSLIFIRKEVFRSFEDHFLNLKGHSGGNITTKTAAEVATKLACGILSPVSAQIEPVRLGEIDRANRIAVEYGKRIFPNQEEIITTLITDYPSHGFVICFEEAKKIFGDTKNIRNINEKEYKLENLLRKFVRLPMDDPFIDCLYSKSIEKQEGVNNGQEGRKTGGENQEETGKNDGEVDRPSEQEKFLTSGSNGN